METGISQLERAIELYKRAFRLWPALDSQIDDGLPRGVRRAAEAAGLDCRFEVALCTSARRIRSEESALRKARSALADSSSRSLKSFWGPNKVL